jgi:hypothetical protein
MAYIGLAEATIKDHLATTSDYYILNVTLPEFWHVTARPGEVRVSAAEEAKHRDC